MAQAYKTSLFFKLVLVLTLVLMISMAAESIDLIGFGKQDSTDLACNSVHGAESGETCSTVAEEFNLSLQDFLSINPNINCNAVFVGQWLCVAASA